MMIMTQSAKPDDDDSPLPAPPAFEALPAVVALVGRSALSVVSLSLPSSESGGVDGDLDGDLDGDRDGD